MYTVYVMQSISSPKDVFVAQTTKDPSLCVVKYNNTQNPKTLTKPLGSMLPLTLRTDLADVCKTYQTQDEATEARKLISEELLKQGFNLKSKRPYFFGRKKSIRDKQTGKYKIVTDPSLYQVDEYRFSNTQGMNSDKLSYGRKKSNEWNDEAAERLQSSIHKNLKKPGKKLND